MTEIINFFNSNFFIGLVTLLVGSVAFGVYRKQKRDAKRDAANVILLEVQSAEQQLQVVRRTQGDELAENVYLMKNSSWDKYRYLFVRDFDRNEWDKISDFYNKCLQYDASVAYASTYFGSNVEKAQGHILGALAGYAKQYVNDFEALPNPDEKQELVDAFKERRSNFLQAFGVINGDESFLSPYFYNPQKPTIDAKAVLETMETNLSITSVGNKLKRMAENRGFFRRLFRRKQ